MQRQQVEMRCASLDQLLPPDHEARYPWAYVEGHDLAPLVPNIKALASRPGRDANDPRVLFALWLYGIFKGIGSARELDRLCQEHLAYQRLCGGMCRVMRLSRPIVTCRPRGGDFPIVSAPRAVTIKEPNPLGVPTPTRSGAAGICPYRSSPEWCHRHVT